jgi:hypothetical protein
MSDFIIICLLLTIILLLIAFNTPEVLFISTFVICCIIVVVGIFYLGYMCFIDPVGFFYNLIFNNPINQFANETVNAIPVMK